MSDQTTSTVTFTPEQILDAARGNVLGFCLVVVAYTKAHGLSTAEFWSFVGRQFAPLWGQGQPAKDVAEGIAINMVSAGCDLRSLSGNESQAEAVLAGWPPELRHGLTQEDADTLWDIFAPIVESTGYRYEWHRQGNEVTVRVLPKL